MKEQKGFDWRSIGTVITCCFFVSALAAAAVRYNTTELTNRVLSVEKEMGHLGKEVDRKADHNTVVECLENLKRAVDRIEKNQEILQKDIKDLIKDKNN